MTAPLLADLPLAQRLERAEAHANMAFVESRRRLAPHVGATWTDLDGTWAMFDGIGSPLTQTFGLGCFGAPSAGHLEALEHFFAQFGDDTRHEVATMADPAVLPLLGERGYRPVEWSAVLCQRLDTLPDTGPVPPALTVTRIAAGDAPHWAEISAQGWAETPELADFVRDFGRVGALAEATQAFLAHLEGVPIATGSLHLHQGVALLAGASTVPIARGRGAQRALLAARLQYARDHGAALAMMVAAPGSASQRNAQRVGFQVVYSRVKWARAASPT